MAETALRPDSVRANPEPASIDSNRHSRRALLGAMAIMPALALPALPAVARSRHTWEAALTAHQIAWRRLEDHPVHDLLPSDPGYASAHADELVCIEATMKSERRVRDTAAPDFQAVIEKLELYTHNYGEDSEGLVKASIADLRRLAAEGR